jgi:large subunit ribosomal protein L29e
MAKSKNHTAHNQTKKQHRLGIKKQSRQRFASLNSVDAKFVRNRRRSIKIMLKKRAEAKGGK